MATLLTADHWPLAMSIALGFLSTLVLLEVSERVRDGDRTVARLWWATGVMTVGSGLWAMHFLALASGYHSAAIAYGAWETIASWVLSLVTVALALEFARRGPEPGLRGGGQAVAVGLALCVAHRAAALSVETSPAVVLDVRLFVASITTGVGVGAAILAAFGVLRRFDGAKGFVVQGAAALVLCVLLAGKDAIAIATTSIPPGAVFAGFVGIHAADLRGTLLLTVPLLLVCTLVGALGHGFADRRRAQLAGSLENVAARLVSAKDEIRRQEMLDPLTRLPNRLLFEDRLAQALRRADRAQKSVRGLREKLAVLFIDLDGFKPINDSFGHAAGDAVLREVAARLRDAARNDDTVSRVGGDQFLVLMEGAESSDDCVALASRILDSLRVPFAVAERNVALSASIGIVVYPDHGERTKLLGQAEAAMQAAKRAGRGTYALFASHMHDAVGDQLALINDLRQAIALGQLALHYQPKIDGRRHVICGVEALLRWQHPVRGAVGAALFIPVAERFGFINTIGAWVIEEACRQMAAWRRDGLRMRVAINLSVHQLREPDLVTRIESALQRHGVPASHLLCEITESVAMQDIDATQRTLDELGRIGVYLSIDDFGTGYSSLSYLRQLPARQLKIDRTFIHDLEQSDDAKAVVDGVVRLAHALGLRVVAEGVETARQRDILLELSCDELQGYFFARPMPADKLLAWVRGDKPVDAVDFAQSLLHAPADG